MNILKLTLFAYILSFLIFYYTKPNMMFNENKQCKQLGTGKNKTILPIWLASTMIGIMTYCGAALVSDILKPLYKKMYKSPMSDLIPVDL